MASCHFLPFNYHFLFAHTHTPALAQYVCVPFSRLPSHTNSHSHNGHICVHKIALLLMVQYGVNTLNSKVRAVNWFRAIDRLCVCVSLLAAVHWRWCKHYCRIRSHRGHFTPLVVSFSFTFGFRFCFIFHSLSLSFFLPWLFKTMREEYDQPVRV